MFNLHLRIADKKSKKQKKTEKKVLKSKKVISDLNEEFTQIELHTKQINYF